ncbi:trehalose-phosphatase [Rhodobacteraceae bacterium 2CG4]|uniref:Trehalose 6-phosphate phosphatase n=1 Tax=Halovulum marinum TaxID=2662447 RepID=A0A6L5YXW7_9RHOB|nr:trehalose-phosphatase [Halovulum marinum]MSU89161.1 trehalose-phosphatase [Halovulum marinum]
MSLPELHPERTALLLDFDGTLVEIAPRPDAITVPAALPALLAALHRRLSGALALVSGREVADIRRYLPEFPGTIIGSHGAERAEPGRTAAPPAALEGLEAIREAVRDFAAKHPALLLEPKAHGVVLHFRQAPELGPQVARFMGELAERHPDFAVQQAKMAWELRPGFADKGRAVRSLLGLDPFTDRIPIYVGDDATDEAAMNVVQDLGGVGIKIGQGSSVAMHRLPDPAALLRWLENAA